MKKLYAFADASTDRRIVSERPNELDCRTVKFNECDFHFLDWILRHNGVRAHFFN